MTKMKDSAAEAEAKAKGTVVAGRWKVIKEERVDSSQTGKTICWSHNSWLEERARNLLVVVRSGRGEKLPARLDKTVLEIPAEKVSSLSFSFTHFPKQRE